MALTSTHTVVQAEIDRLKAIRAMPYHPRTDIADLLDARVKGMIDGLQWAQDKYHNKSLIGDSQD